MPIRERVEIEGLDAVTADLDRMARAGEDAFETLADGASEAQDAIDDLGDRVDRTGGQFDGARDRASGLGSTLGTLGKAGVAGIAIAGLKSLADTAIGAASALIEVATAGAQANAAQAAFEQLGASIEGLRDASNGVFDDTTLQQFALAGEALGVTAQEVGNISRLAAARLDAGLIQDVGEAAALTTAAIRGEAGALEQLGVRIDTTSAQFVGLSEAQKKLAIAQTAAVEGAALQGEALDSQISKFAQAQTGYDNFISSIQQSVANFVAASGVLETFQGVLDQVGGVIAENEETFAALATGLGQLAADVIPLVVDRFVELAEDARPVLTVLGAIFDIVDAGRTIFDSVKGSIEGFAESIGLAGGELGVFGDVIGLVFSPLEAVGGLVNLAAEGLGDLASSARSTAQSITGETVPALDLITTKLGDFENGLLDAAAAQRQLRREQIALAELENREAGRRAAEEERRARIEEREYERYLEAERQRQIRIRQERETASAVRRVTQEVGATGDAFASLIDIGTGTGRSLAATIIGDVGRIERGITLLGELRTAGESILAFADDAVFGLDKRIASFVSNPFGVDEAANDDGIEQIRAVTDEIGGLVGTLNELAGAAGDETPIGRFANGFAAAAEVIGANAGNISEAIANIGKGAEAEGKAIAVLGGTALQAFGAVAKAAGASAKEMAGIRIFLALAEGFLQLAIPNPAGAVAAFTSAALYGVLAGVSASASSGAGASAASSAQASLGTNTRDTGGRAGPASVPPLEVNFNGIPTPDSTADSLIQAYERAAEIRGGREAA